jgi:hypothetical protein
MFFSYGRALVMLGDYKEARVKLQTAHKLAPSNEIINKELSKVCLCSNIWQGYQYLYKAA